MYVPCIYLLSMMAGKIIQTYETVTVGHSLCVGLGYHVRGKIRGRWGLDVPRQHVAQGSLREPKYPNARKVVTEWRAAKFSSFFFFSPHNCVCIDQCHPSENPISERLLLNALFNDQKYPAELLDPA